MDSEALARADRIFFNRVAAWLSRSFGDDLEHQACPPVLRAAVHEHSRVEHGEDFATIRADVDALLEQVRTAGDGLNDTLPPDPYTRINARWHIGAKITAQEVGELLNLALERHLLARRLAAEPQAAHNEVRTRYMVTGSTASLAEWAVHFMEHDPECAFMADAGHACSCGMVNAREAMREFFVRLLPDA